MSQPLHNSPLSPDGSWRWNGSQWVPNMPGSEQEPVPVLARESGFPTSETSVPAGPLSPSLAADNDDLSRALAERRRSKPIPRTGLRNLLYKVTGGRVNLGASERELHQLQLIQKIRSGITSRPHRLGVGSAKGGVGKTTLSLLLTSLLGLERKDLPIYVEANPHHGTCRERVHLQHEESISDLLEFLCSRGGPELDLEVGQPRVNSFAPVVSEMGMAVLTAPRDSWTRAALNEGSYRRILRLLYHYCQSFLTLDLGTGLVDSATTYAFQVCDQALIVSSPTADTASLADKTMRYVADLRGAEFVRERVLVAINEVDGSKSAKQDVEVLTNHFSRHVRKVLHVHRDPHLAEGTFLDWSKISRPVRDDLLEVAAEVASGFALGFAHDNDPVLEERKLQDLTGSAAT
ncbi:MinD/ParA family ATP-binding protein [Candidatus Dormibacter sp.]|uniref:MinD/ParA family ATP-binding protein n=1 Tax=Candidatus Dormibacter sp. TaxID=2973982 RepID=UPI0026CF6338